MRAGALVLVFLMATTSAAAERRNPLEGHPPVGCGLGCLFPDRTAHVTAMVTAGLRLGSQVHDEGAFGLRGRYHLDDATAIGVDAELGTRAVDPDVRAATGAKLARPAGRDRALAIVQRDLATARWRHRRVDLTASLGAGVVTGGEPAVAGGLSLRVQLGGALGAELGVRHDGDGATWLTLGVGLVSDLPPTPRGCFE